MWPHPTPDIEKSPITSCGRDLCQCRIGILFWGHSSQILFNSKYYVGSLHRTDADIVRGKLFFFLETDVSLKYTEKKMNFKETVFKHN